MLQTPPLTIAAAMFVGTPIANAEHASHARLNAMAPVCRLILKAQGLNWRMLGLARAPTVSRQPIFKFDDQVSHKPLSQRIIGLGREKTKLIQPMMKVLER